MRPGFAVGDQVPAAGRWAAGGCAPRRSVAWVRGHVISGPETRPGTRAADLPVRPLLPLPDSGTAAEPAFQLVVGNAVLGGPGLELRSINRIGQRPRRLLSKFCPPSVTKQVDDMLPAEFLWSHNYRQSLLVLKHSLAVISARLAQLDPQGPPTPGHGARAALRDLVHPGRVRQWPSLVSPPRRTVPMLPASTRRAPRRYESS
jgi:hypothetical protein